ncbi:hypothetical protein HCH_00156 [Hahella chejuensis KCTC 2396]|uniref:Uncharacterized protein n=1 Tax=Hahella chejuensis (strain KCTC 2396) TaxID=349521 RepID=Q2SQJ9_HAHCH|nr:hypothetical protein HCH_00156 [Hahella chejuensis KCTC 2396]
MQKIQGRTLLQHINSIFFIQINFSAIHPEKDLLRIPRHVWPIGEH